MTEERITNETTGGEKGRKLARFDLVPPEAMWALAEAFGAGAAKYSDRNWERGYDWSLSYGALQRHLWQFWNGEDIDAETGTPHIVSAMWHCAVLTTYQLSGNVQFDDRPTYFSGTPLEELRGAEE